MAVAVAAIRPEPSLDRTACIARLIPGQKVVRPGLHKPPRSVLADGTIRLPAEDKARGFQTARIADFFLPAAFSEDAPPGLYAALLTDVSCVLGSWLGFACLQGIWAAGLRAPQLTGNLAARGRFLGTALLFALLVTLLGYAEGLYREPRSRGLHSIVILAKSVLWAAVVISVCVQFAGPSESSLEGIGGSALLTFAALVLRRTWRVRTKAGANQKRTRNVLVVGPEATVREVATYIKQHPEFQRAVRGSLNEESLLARGFPHLAEKLATLARAEFVDEVILVAPFRREFAQTIIREARRNHLDVKVVPDLYGYELGKRRIEDLGIAPLLTLHEERFPGTGLSLKRLLDRVASGSALLALGPLMLGISCLVKIDSPGPALYSALRAGRKGKRFRCHKFRTMVVNAGDIKERLRKQNEREGPTFKIADDPRITRVGRWLRRYSLDELPQLWNVFMGDMSLVGPRPHPLDDFARYELEHLPRLDVTPGITGLWQVTARRDSSFQINMALDLEYIERWSLWMDLRILLRTVAVVLQGTGA